MLFFIRVSLSFLISLITASSSFDQGAFFFSYDDIGEGTHLAHVEYPHRHIVVTAQTDGREIHDSELHVQNFVIGQTIVLDSRRVFHRIRRIDTINLSCFQYKISIDLNSPQASGGICGKEGVSSTGTKNDHITIFEVTDGSTAVIVLNDTTHGNRGHHPSTNIGTFQRITQRQTIHHGGQHSHVVTSDPIHACLMQCGSTKEISATDHQADLNTDSDQLADFQSHPVQDLRINTERLIPHQGFTA